jgi:uncharacterized repeat protein (TIGR03803 family)
MISWIEAGCAGTRCAAGAVALALCGLASSQPAAAAPSLTTLYAFSGNGVDGGNPASPLVFDSSGNLYGSATFEFVGGYVFQLAPPVAAGGGWTHSTIYTTQSIDLPVNLTIAPSGVLYGTSAGGFIGQQFFPGSVFQLEHTQSGWSSAVTHRFNGPYALSGAALLDSRGDVYGVSANGGPNGGGQVFELAALPGGGLAKIALVSFASAGAPYGALISDGEGHLFGTTSGGSSGNGTIYALTYVPGQGWVKSILYRFTGMDDGGAPMTGLAMDSAGNLYGTTTKGGSSDGGTIFELSPPVPGTGYAWTETTLIDSFGSAASKKGPLILDSAGNLYGTAGGGGANGFGSVFEVSPSTSGTGWSKTALWQFADGPDGGNPLAGVILGADGNLYGTTSSGGSGGHGTVFALTP